jgi:hypothetical protein
MLRLKPEHVGERIGKGEECLKETEVVIELRRVVFVLRGVYPKITRASGFQV